MFSTARAMRPLATTIVVAALLGANACGGDNAAQPANDVASVQIIVAPTNPRVGETTLVSATPVNAGGIRVQGVACAYASNAPGVAAAVPSGADAIVTGLSVGTATITATCANRNNSVLITVRPPLVKLTLTKLGSTPGALFANSAGLSYDLGTVVTVTASSVAGSVFAGWGGACAGVGACVVPMTADMTVTGTFEPRFSLTITLAGTGAGVVTVDPPGLSYAPNIRVTLTPVPSANSAFTGWGGACAGMGACVIMMDANKAVTATFAPVAAVAVTVGNVTWACAISASPLPGWRNCTGTVALTISRPISSGYVAVYFNFPDNSAFFHGELQVGLGTPGAVIVNLVNEYVSRCQSPFATTVDVYNGRQSTQNAPLLVSVPVTLTGC